MITVTRRDEAVAFLVSRARMEAILETMEILANQAAMDQVHRYEAGELRLRDAGVLDEE